MLLFQGIEDVGVVLIRAWREGKIAMLGAVLQGVDETHDNNSFVA
jgi:hypothetical protein